MITLADATQLIHEIINEKNANTDKYTLMISKVETYDFGWIFYYTSKEYHETKNIRYMLLGNSPFLVDKEDGAIHKTGTARSIDYYIDKYRKLKNAKRVK